MVNGQSQFTETDNGNLHTYSTDNTTKNTSERESEKEFSQPLPPVSEIQNLDEVDPDEVNDPLINQPIIQNGKLIDSQSTKKTISNSKTSFKAVVCELLEKNPFSLALALESPFTFGRKATGTVGASSCSLPKVKALALHGRCRGPLS